MARLEIGLFENFKNARCKLEFFGDSVNSEQLSFNNIAEGGEALLSV
jgi:hypothetical protein